MVSAAVITFLCPFVLTPDWGAMQTPAEWNRTYAQYEQSEFVPVPRYDTGAMLTPVSVLGPLRNSGSVSAKDLLTMKIFYSTKFLGKYDLDAGEGSGDHTGIDLKQPLGAAIRAIGSGKVTKVVKKDKIYGNYIEITHADGFVSLYGHMDKMIVKKNRKIRAGQRIGTVGMTGKTVAPHVHLELHRDGVLVNPMDFVSCGR